MLPSQIDHLGDNTDGVYGDSGAPPGACHETYTGFRFTCWRTAHSGPPPGGAQKKNVLVGRQGLFGHSDSKCRLLEDGGAVGAQVPVTG